jgi:hypothetical protein
VRPISLRSFPCRSLAPIAPIAGAIPGHLATPMSEQARPGHLPSSRYLGCHLKDIVLLLHHCTDAAATTPPQCRDKSPANKAPTVCSLGPSCRRLRQLCACLGPSCRPHHRVELPAPTPLGVCPLLHGHRCRTLPPRCSDSHMKTRPLPRAIPSAFPSRAAGCCQPCPHAASLRAVRKCPSTAPCAPALAYKEGHMHLLSAPSPPPKPIRQDIAATRLPYFRRATNDDPPHGLPWLVRRSRRLPVVGGSLRGQPRHTWATGAPPHRGQTATRSPFSVSCRAEIPPFLFVVMMHSSFPPQHAELL